MNDFEKYKQGIMNQFSPVSVEEAVWIKSKNSSDKPLILSFRTEVPNYIDIPGETIRTKVYEFKKLPNYC